MSETTDDPGEPVLAATVRTFLGESAKRLGLADGVRAWLQAADRELHVKVPVVGDDGELRVFDGYRVQHSNVRGPYKGGLRFDDEVSRAETLALAQLMTFKTAAADLPLGGGKGGVACPAKDLSERELEQVARGLARALAPNLGVDTDVMAPDMNTDEQTMAHIADELGGAGTAFEPGVVTGKPIALGGSPGRSAATGRGVVIAYELLRERAELEPDGTRVAIQGTGNVGMWAARLFTDLGCRVVAMGKSDGTAIAEDGLDPSALEAHLAEHGAIEGFEGAEVGEADDILDVECEVFVPAARAGMVDADAAERLSGCRMVIEGANGPLTPEADRILRNGGALIVPDLLADTGGVVVSYFEWLQNRRRERWTEDEVNTRLRETMCAALAAAVERAERDGGSLRAAGYDIAAERVLEAARLRHRLP